MVSRARPLPLPPIFPNLLPPILPSTMDFQFQQFLAKSNTITVYHDVNSPSIGFSTTTVSWTKEELGPGWAMDDVYPPLAELRRALLTDAEWAAMSSWEKDLCEMYYRPDWERLSCIEEILKTTPAAKRAEKHAEILEGLRAITAAASTSAPTASAPGCDVSADVVPDDGGGAPAPKSMAKCDVTSELTSSVMPATDYTDPSGASRDDRPIGAVLLSVAPAFNLMAGAHDEGYTPSPMSPTRCSTHCGPVKSWFCAASAIRPCVQPVPPRPPDPWDFFRKAHGFLLMGSSDLAAEILCSASVNLCTVGHSPEDVVDEFTCKRVDKHGGFAAKMKKRMKHVKTWRRLARKLKDINGRLQGAMKRKEHYAMPEMNRNAGCSAVHANEALNFTRDEDLVGITESKEQLIQCLTSDLEERSQISTVWGMPGVGKTTLAAHVYKTVRADFDASAWVTVSESYRVDDLLKKIAREFGIALDEANMEMRSLAETIHQNQLGKRYILVLDDVWTPDVWSEIRTVFPSNCIGGVVITSRNHEVSLLATSKSPIHVKPLNEGNSWELLCKSAFGNDGDRKCPLELQNLAWKFVEKCEGLPIALTCIGSLLSGKDQNSAEWKKVYDELELQLVKNVMHRVETILKVSLEHLPYDLKNCFLHCALLPEDYSIKRGTIIRHWIAAGFIKTKKNKTLEEVGEEYLAELVNRSLLQVVERNYAGRLKVCRMHDVIRFVALNKAEKECIGKVYDGSGEFSVGLTRRISIQSENLGQLTPSDATHIRALHVFERNINIDLLRPILRSSSLLSMLDLQGALIKVLPAEVFNLFNLRYLGLRHTDIESLPEALGRLQNLEVLDAADTKLSYLPNSIVELQNMRYLYATIDSRGREFIPFGGVKVPRGIRRLTALHALQCVKASSEILREVGALTELRTFGVSDVRSEHSSALSDAINKMNHLDHLEITAAGEEEVLQLQGLCLPPTISCLGLEGKLEKTSMTQVISSWSNFNSLTRLRLSLSKIDEESFCSLLLLQGLCHLRISKAFEGKKLHFGAGSFPKLRVLEIFLAPQLNQVEIEEGAMASLVSLELWVCPELKFLPGGIEHLTALEELYLEDTSEELIEKLRQSRGPNECNEELKKVSHIRKVTVALTEKGIWERIR